MSGHNPIGTRTLRTAALAGIIFVFLVAIVSAQPGPRSNVDVLGDMAIGCIGGVPDSLTSFVLESPGRMPYLRSRLTNYWLERGQEVFVSDSISSAARLAGLARLKYDPENVRVSYESADDSQLRRTVSIAIAHSLIAASGLVLDDGRCRDESSDTIQRSDIVLVQRDPFPETHAEIPAEGSWKRWAEPVVLGAAVGVVAYLFFSIRSS